MAAFTLKKCPNSSVQPKNNTPPHPHATFRWPLEKLSWSPASSSLVPSLHVLHSIECRPHWPCFLVLVYQACNLLQDWGCVQLLCNIHPVPSIKQVLNKYTLKIHINQFLCSGTYRKGKSDLGGHETIPPNLRHIRSDYLGLDGHTMTLVTESENKALGPIIYNSAHNYKQCSH